jgi:hypothetical protein
MPIRRIVKGFYIDRAGSGPDSGSSVSGRLYHEEPFAQICSFLCGKAGEVDSVSWKKGLADYEDGLIKIGLDHHNAAAQSSKSVPHIAKHEWTSDQSLRGAILTHAVSVLAEDHLQDLRYQKLADATIIARTSMDRIAEVPGEYQFSLRSQWRDSLNNLLPDGEEVLEIINDRYIQKD